MTKLIINIEEPFQHLPLAPIVEAVIDIRARAVTVLEEALVKPSLEAKLSGYQFLDSQREIEHKFTLEGGEPPGLMLRDLGWKGLRFQSTDKKHIAQFNRDGFVFSRLESYQSWEQLYEEGMRLWHVYVELAQPIEIHRIGLRYINRIQLPPDELRFGDYLEAAPVPPKGLDLSFHGFMHQDTLSVPDHPYAINVIRTIQPPNVPSGMGLGLIIDIDVFTIKGVELNEAAMEQRWLEMRWLKNKVFFASVTSNALQLFQ
ncbi:MAG: TIGR04255 family protein [Gammaproteobacteria bacterium]